jgi:hypothetical protein
VVTSDSLFCPHSKAWARATAVYKNQEGFTVLEAYLEGILPGNPEREVLKVMVDEGDPTNRFEDGQK